MPHSGHDDQKIMVSLTNKAAGAFVFLVLFFIFKYSSTLVYACSCSPGVPHLEILYMVLPPCIMYLLLYAMNRNYQRLFCRGPFRRCNHCCSFTVQQILQLFTIGLVWIAAVFINGDWFVCFKGNQDEIHMKIPCTKKDNLTYEENKFILKCKNESMVIGLSLTLIAAALLVMGSFLFFKKGKCGDSYYKRFYLDRLSEETETNLRTALIELARERSKVIAREPIKMIRETERLPKAQPGENNTRNRDLRADVEKEWESISESFFYQLERDESYEMSLFNGHLEKEKDTAIIQSLQGQAEGEAAVTNKTRLAKFLVELARETLGEGEERSYQTDQT